MVQFGSKTTPSGSPKLGPGLAGHFKNELRHGVFEKKKTSASGFEFTLNKDGNPVLRVDSSDGSRIFVPYAQTLEKYYHMDVFGLEGPKNFDSNYAQSLGLEERRAYLKKTVPKEHVIKLQIEIAKSLTNDNYTKVPGFIGARKDPG